MSRTRLPFEKSCPLFLRTRPSALLVCAFAGMLVGCFAGGGGHHNGTGPANQRIDLTSDVTVDSQPGGPNLTFSDGVNATLHFTVSNSGDKPSDQTITVTVGLPAGLTYVSFASVAPNAWTCAASGQNVTCTSSASFSVPALATGPNAVPAFTIQVSVANDASGNEQLPITITTPDGSPATNSGAKGVNFIQAKPNISSLNPTSGTGGTTVTISGSSFGSSQGASTVTFNGVKATNISSGNWSATSIVANVPAGTPQGPGPVLVTVNGVASNSMTFTVTGPQITSLNPSSGPVGTQVVISGSSFGASQGTSTVTFNGVPASNSTWSDTSITAAVPAGATTGNVVVTVAGIPSNAVSFTVTGVQPQINSVSPNSGPVGTTVTIAGSNFGASQGTSTISFNGTDATRITGWNATTVVADVPSGAASGNVVVTVGGIASTSSVATQFTVTPSVCANGGNAASLLAGDYAFRAQGVVSSSAPGIFRALAGRFHADGINTISNGLVEYNDDFTGPTGTINSFTGCFVLNTPNNASGVALGTMTMVNGSTAFTFGIAVRTNGNGNLLDLTADSPQSGGFEKQCPNAPGGTCSAFSSSSVSGGYVFGFDGVTANGVTANASTVGRFGASSGNLSGAVIDISTFGGVVALNDAFTGSYNVTDTTNGRAEITANVTYNNGTASGTAETLHFACYLAAVNNAGVATAQYCIGLDLDTATLPVLGGRIFSQNTPAGGWTTANAAPASKASVIWSTGINGGGNARVAIGQLTYNTSTNPATVTINQDLNNGGAYTLQQVVENISVASNGQLQASISGSLAAVCYMLDPGKAECVNEANNAALDYVVPQEAAPAGGFTTANFQNSYALGTLDPVTWGNSGIDGVLTSTAAGGSLDGSLNMNSNASGISTPSLAGTYAIASGTDATIGRVTITETSPASDTVYLYIIDAGTAVAISSTSMEPVVLNLKN